jgi:hypothetical protein
LSSWTRRCAGSGVTSSSPGLDGSLGSGTILREEGELGSLRAFVDERRDAPAALVLEGTRESGSRRSGSPVSSTHARRRCFTVDGNRSVGHYGVYANGLDGVTVKNGVVRDFYSGVDHLGERRLRHRRGR